MTIVVFSPVNPLVGRCLGVTLWMCCWWVTDCSPMYVTALLPLVLFPLMGILSASEVAKQYVDSLSFIQLGGAMVALALARWGLQQRMALFAMSKVGARPEVLLLAFSWITFFLSMWISNTTTTLLMLTNVLALLSQLEPPVGEISDIYEKQRKEVSAFGKMVLLSISWSSSIGGASSLVGTATNLIFVNVYSVNFPDGVEITFAKWFTYCFPVSFILNIFCWFLLVCLFWFLRGSIRGTSNFAGLTKASLKERYLSLPKICYEEIVVLVDFCALAILFMFRSDIDFGVFVLPGWGRVFPKNFANDSTVAILCGGIMYLIPGRRSYTAAQRHTPSSEDRSQYDRASLEEPLSAESNVGSANSVELRELPTDHVALDILPHTSEQAPELSTSLVMQRPLINETMHTTQRDPSSCCTLQHCTPRIIYKKLFSWADTKILDADSFKELPWDVIILLGGGLALAQGLNASGLGSWFGSLLNDLQGVPLWVLVLIASLMTKALTEITVNVAAATILLPVVASLAIATGTEPLVLMIPATLCASFAFMLPTACASNLIVFSSRKLQIHEMLLWGSFLSLLCIGILTLVSILGEGWLGWSFGLSSLSTSGSISSSSTSSIFLRE